MHLPSGHVDDKTLIACLLLEISLKFHMAKQLTDRIV